MLKIFLGGILAVGGGFLAKLFSDWRDGRNMRPAIAAEIQAIIHMLKQENFIRAIEGEIAWLEATHLPRGFPVTFRNTYNAVFAANASKLGLIARSKKHDFWWGDEDLVRDLVRFYYSVQTVIELSELIRDAQLVQSSDKSSGSTDQLIAMEVFSLSDPENRLVEFRRLLDQTKEGQALGLNLIERLE